MFRPILVSYRHTRQSLACSDQDVLLLLLLLLLAVVQFAVQCCSVVCAVGRAAVVLFSGEQVGKPVGSSERSLLQLLQLLFAYQVCV